MLGDSIDTRISSRFRSKLCNLLLLLLLAVTLEIFSAATAFSSSLASNQHRAFEAFVPLHKGTLLNMAYNSGDDRGNRCQGQRQKDKDPRRREATTNAAPMYITIGPQCCGKSSFLRNFGNGTIKDISLDDQQDVYVPIPTEIFLHAYVDEEDGDTKTDKEQDPLIQQVYQEKTLAERIRENIELILILRRWNGNSSASDFERRIKDYYEERRMDGKVAMALIETVEDFLSNQPDLPKETDVFVLESLFKPHPQTGQSAIQKAHEELRETPKHIPVAWGNTNSKAKDYERALEICHQTRRPVHFILCHPEHGRGDVNGGNNESSLMTLPWLPLKELLKRNLHRLQTHGKFVPANAIADCCQRVEAMVPPYVLKRGSNETYGNQSIEEHLVAIASPSPGGRGPRQQDNRRPSAPFRYYLTKHRLVQKEYPRKDYRQNNYDRNSGGRYNGGRGRGRGRGNQGRGYSDNRGNNRRRYDGGSGGDERNGGYRNQPRPPPNQEDAPPRARRRYDDAGRNDNNPRSTR